MSNNAQRVEFYYKEKHKWFAMFAARPTARSPIGREPYIKRIILKSQTKGPITGINREWPRYYDQADALLLPCSLYDYNELDFGISSFPHFSIDVLIFATQTLSSVRSISQ